MSKISISIPFTKNCDDAWLDWIEFYYSLSQRPDQAQAQQGQTSEVNGVDQDHQLKNGKNDSRMDGFGEYYDVDETSIFEGDEFELVGKYCFH